MVEEWIHLLDLFAPIAMAAITMMGLWVRKLIDEISSLKSNMASMDETMQREHGDVLKAINELDSKLTLEVRGLINQHAEHEKVQAIIEERLGDIKRKMMD